MQQTKKIDDVLSVWPLHVVCGAWGRIATGIFGLESLGGMGGVAFSAQVIGSVAGIVVAIVGGLVVYGVLSKVTNIRLTQEEEFIGADLSIHSIGSVNHD
jgi:Amt family ammonium transporter